jgi:two-component system OmpR family sensor kinase
LISTLSLLFSIAYWYYGIEKEKYEKDIQNELQIHNEQLFNFIKQEQFKRNKIIQYPQTDKFKSSLYDIDKNLIFGTFKEKNIDLSRKFYYKNGYSYGVFKVTPYYLGAAYIVIQQENDSVFQKIITKMLPPILIVLFILSTTSLFLVKLLLKPMKQNIELLDRFIKDTTHELNTPLSTILTNIEQIESKNKDITINKKLVRIKTASITISNIYEDLVYLTLNHKVSKNDQNLPLNNIIKERLEYFESFFISKNLNITLEEKTQTSIYIDHTKLVRVIDNLLSNSIKYTNKNKAINITIDRNKFTICDEGKGMNQEEIKKVFERYSRFDTTQGGFGIGYNIIHTIAKEYNISIKINSIIDEGTCVILQW